MRPFSLDFETETPFGEALERVKASLKERGFGTLSEIDVRATLQEKVGVDIGPYTILGVCNPALAREALATEPKIGVFLPCTVVVREDGALVRFHGQDPVMMGEIVGDPALADVSQEVRRRIEEALQEAATGKIPAPAA